MKTVAASIVEAKRRFSEFVAKSAFSGFRVVLTKRGRPVAAMVSMEDLRELEQMDKRRGLSSIIGKWEDFDEIEDSVLKAVESRRVEGPGRNVSL